MSKKECKKKKITKKEPDIVMMKYSCSKCGLYSVMPKHLCKPEKIWHFFFMKAMIFTSGLQGKLLPQYADNPKALVKINGEPLLEVLIKRLVDSGFTEIILNVHHFAALISNYLKEKKHENTIPNNRPQKQNRLQGSRTARSQRMETIPTPWLQHNTTLPRT